jgi:hypothetical protein
VKISRVQLSSLISEIINEGRLERRMKRYADRDHKFMTLRDLYSFRFMEQFGGIPFEKMIEASSEDAVALFVGMAGIDYFNLQEDEMRKIIQKRQGDLISLYHEFTKLLETLQNPSLLQKIYDTSFNRMDQSSSGSETQKLAVGLIKSTIRKMKQALTFDGDLIKWLRSDGLNKEADLFQDALDKAGLERDHTDITFFK